MGTDFQWDFLGVIFIWNFTCKQAEISTIRPSLSGHHSRVSSINGIPVVALPLRREVFDAASVFIVNLPAAEKCCSIVQFFNEQN